jgi:glycosyltransferase involved in cell wall biosynthesis
MDGGQIDGCFTLQSPVRPDLGLNVAGAWWKLVQSLAGRKKGGFKFTPTFLDHVWGRYLPLLSGTSILSNFQVLGSPFWRQAERLDIDASFYIDGTLHEYFTTYADFDVVAIIDKATQAEAIENERLGYQRARSIVAMSQRSADDLKTFYGVRPEKIAIVSPGANLPDEAIEGFKTSTASRRDDFVLGFVGLYPLRKGLDRLAEALAILRGRRLPVRLRVIGECPDDIRNQDGVDYLGVIRKSTQMPEFLAAISDIDLGCQLSRAELVGVAMLEFLRFGIPILATDVGGIPEVMQGGGGVMVPPDIDAEQLAETISVLVTDRDRHARLKADAEGRREWASWSRAAREIDVAMSR